MAYSSSNNDLKKGSHVMTGYGSGVVVQSRRPTDGVCVVQLPFGYMYTHPDVYPVRRVRTTAQMNAAFEALEQMRVLNLQVECNERGIVYEESKCKLCLLLHDGDDENDDENDTKNQTSSFLSYIPNPLAAVSKKKKKEEDPRCLLCANPTCRHHASPTFARERITVCVECEALCQSRGLEADLAAGLRSQLERLTDAYDRAFLLLQYSSQFIPQLVEQLQAEQERDDKVTLGTSSVGFLSGIMGFAGAAALLTPAGPPLLMASFVFGTGNAAVGLGYSAQKHWYSTSTADTNPTHVANRLLALYGFLQAAMERTVTLREQVHADPNLGDIESSNDKDDSGKSRNAYLQALSQGVNVTKRTNTTLRVTNAAGYTTSSSLFEAIGAAPVIGQAFSAAMMVVDYQTAATTLEKIKQGSVNEKAKTLQQYCEMSALIQLPTTEDLETEVQDILRAVEQSH